CDNILNVNNLLTKKMVNLNSVDHVISNFDVIPENIIQSGNLGPSGTSQQTVFLDHYIYICSIKMQLRRSSNFLPVLYM
ncbi:hypothetical protein, partial [Photobacterium minamisatsumaniensis]|uniref:hypothetical protein n=1 Tax=Photobacterium minamisatsumaniensis TaxID=2910233 RepID=UPI003D0C7DEC